MATRSRRRRHRAAAAVRVLHVPLGSRVFGRLERLKGDGRSWPKFLADVAELPEVAA